MVDAAVLVGEPTDVRGLLDRAIAMGIPVVALSRELRQHAEPDELASLPEERPRLREMLPD